MADADTRGLIGWFATNHVAANLLMFFIIGLGVYSLYIVKKESFPGMNVNQVSVMVAYPGAAPQEVEEGVVVKIEEAVKTIRGISEIRATAREGMGTVSLELEDSYDVGEVTDDVKLAIDGISTFPVEIERPTITRQLFRRGALNVQVHGDLDEATMKEQVELIRDEITALPEVSYAEVMGSRPFEIAVEISENTLRQYGLTMDQVVQTIRRWSVDLPGGAIRTEGGDIRLRTKGQAYTGSDFEQIVLFTGRDGTRVTLGDIATIKDGFAEIESFSFFDGERSFGVNVMSNPDENEIAISEAVHRYVAQRADTLPPGIKLTAWMDSSFYLKDRLNMMLENMALGAVLVFFVLGLFLHLKIASWVIVGLPVAFLGAFMMLPVVGVTINTMSLFAFILVIGIVVDDAIVIAESVYTYTEEHGYTVANIVAGARRVAVPATFGVLTTIMAFLPLLFVTGMIVAITEAIGWVVVFCLAFSLVESKLILPAHLSMMKSSHGTKAGFADLADRGLKRFVSHVYMPFLKRAIEYRYATLAFFIALIIAMGGLVGGGVIRFVFFPEIDSDFVMVNIELEDGMPETLIQDIVVQLDSDLRAVNEEIKADTGSEINVAEHMFAYIQGGTRGMLQVELHKGEGRPVNPKELELRWREKVGDIAGTKELTFRSSMHMGGGPPIALKLQGRNIERLEQAADELVEHLRSYDGVYEVSSSANKGPEELMLKIKPEGEALGITLVDLARQVRQAFYGAEAQRIQRGNQEVKVMVRYPRDQRQSIGNLENMWIRTPDGRELPFSSVAEYDMQKGYASITRNDGQRAVTVTANVNNTITQPMVVMGQVRRDFMPDLLRRNPGLSYDLAGSSMQERMSLGQLGYAFLAALFGIYALMAIPLRSYIQPLMIMSVIPFGAIGAVIGHMVLGIAINSISMIGIIALSGVVVNDSLIMIYFVNNRMRDGASRSEAAIESGAVRFRPILLTSLTTFFGLVPILSESSMQAQMVIPMAVSLAFGILFATLITLILVPCLYNIIGDFSSEPTAEQAVPAI
jgi:multidrug efflux pump subunit AcrB|tara:strand:+ start:2754 stop:5858 length:3105 start_codon:yes stop_codon:yes gene_type:complete